MGFIKNAFWTVAVLMNLLAALLFWYIVFAMVTRPTTFLAGQGYILIAIGMSVLPVMAAIAVEKAR